MIVDTPAKLVTIIVNTSQQHAGRSLYSVVVKLAEEKGLAGATVTRCVEGFGAHGHHTTRFLALSEDLPVRIDLVDVPEKLAPFLTALEPLMASGGLVTIQDVQMRHFPAPPR